MAGNVVGLRDIGKDGPAIFRNHVERVADDLGSESPGLGDFSDGPIGPPIACENNGIDTGQVFPALVGDEPNVVVGIDFDVVDVLDATDFLFVSAVEQVPARRALARNDRSLRPRKPWRRPRRDNPRLAYRSDLRQSPGYSRRASAVLREGRRLSSC